MTTLIMNVQQILLAIFLHGAAQISKFELFFKCRTPYILEDELVTNRISANLGE